MAALRASNADLFALQEIPEELLAELQVLGIDELLPHCVVAPAPLWAGPPTRGTPTTGWGA